MFILISRGAGRWTLITFERFLCQQTDRLLAGVLYLMERHESAINSYLTISRKVKNHLYFIFTNQDRIQCMTNLRLFCKKTKQAQINHCDWQLQTCCAVCHNTIAVSIRLCRDGCHDTPVYCYQSALRSYSTLKLGYFGLFCRKTQKHVLLGNMPTQHAGLCPKLPCSIVVAFYLKTERNQGFGC